MKIYAIHDRLIGHFDIPFAAMDDHQVLASIGKFINGPEGATYSALKQAPHHFEIWQLGEVTEEKDLVPKKQLIATCDSLIRPGIRQAATERTPPSEAKSSENESRSLPSGNRAHPATPGAAFARSPQSEP